MDYSTTNLAKKIGKTAQTVRNTAKKLGIVPAETQNGGLVFSFDQAEQICAHYGIKLENLAKEEANLAKFGKEGKKEQVEEALAQTNRKNEDEEVIRELRRLVEERQRGLIEKDRQIEQLTAKHEEEVRSLRAQLERSESSREAQMDIISKLQDLLDKRGDEARRYLDNSSKLIEQLTQANQAIVALSTVQAAALAPVGHRTFGQRVKAALAAFKGESEEQE